MKNSIYKLLGLVLLSASLLTITGCGSSTQQAPSNKEVQASKGKQMAESIRYSTNVEQENIKKRLLLTGKPGALGYVLLLNSAGQPIMYTTVKGKITSSGKRLTSKQELKRMVAKTSTGYDTYDYSVVDAPSDEGTYGSSSPYVYFWATSGQYIQWSGQYLYSDQPFRLDVKPLVVSITTK